MTEEEKKAIKYYQEKEFSFIVDNVNIKEFLKALGITEEDSFENHKIRFKTLLNLIEKQQKEIERHQRVIRDKIKELEKLQKRYEEELLQYGDYNIDRPCYSDLILEVKHKIQVLKEISGEEYAR